MNSAVINAERSPKQGIVFCFLLLIILTAGFSLRFIGLNDRPMHTDEAVNAYQIGKILQGEAFHYDSKDHHGPLYFAMSAGVCKLAGSRNISEMTERELRFSAVLSSLVGLLFLIAYARLVGIVAASFAGLIWVIDPFCVYYGRYAIHESLFLSLTLGFLVSLLLALEKKDPLWVSACGLLMGAMIATKETAVLSIVSALVSLFFITKGPVSWPSLRMGLLFCFSAVMVIVPAFTWGFCNFSGLSEMLAAGGNALERGSGVGHEKPFFYYGELFLKLRSGLLLLILAIAGATISWRTKTGKFFSIYSAIIFLLYSSIPYKTPWLVLNIWLPLMLLASLGLSSLLRRNLIMAVFVVLLFSYCCWRDLNYRVFHNSSAENNPLAYAHTSTDLLNLPVTLARIQSQRESPLHIAVVAEDPWPLPWYLRGYSKVGYWRPGAKMPEADILILDQGEAEKLDLESNARRPSIFGQRPGALLLLYEKMEEVKK